MRRARDDKGHYTAAAGFFCRHNDATRNDPQSAACSLAYQLAQQLQSVKTAHLEKCEEIKLVFNGASTDIVSEQLAVAIESVKEELDEAITGFVLSQWIRLRLSQNILVSAIGKIS